jgi:flagellin-like protein
LGEEDKNMNNENRNEEAVSPVIATILMVAITVVLAGVLYVWASSLADDSTGGGLDKYQFDSRDAAGSMSSDAGDALVHIKMTQGDDLSWSVLRVSVVVDGGNSFTCADASKDDGTAACTYTTDDDNSWSTSEEITISEGATNMCDGSDGGCDVDVTLTKVGVGNEDDKVIREVSAYADANN